jgi:integrase/recombinase XerD
LLGNSARKENIMEPSYESAAALVRHAAGPLTDQLGAFVAWLIEQQYAASVVNIKARHALAFDRWLATRGVALADLKEVHVKRYQRRRGHRSIRGETRRRECYEVTQLLQFLRSHGVCEAPRLQPTPVDDLAADFGRYLQHRQGLATTTVKRYRTVASQFLHGRFDHGEIDLRTLRSVDAIEFVQREAKRIKPPALKCVVNAMRSFLRYAQYRGEIGPELVAAVPAVATWATTPPLPRAMRSVGAIVPCCCS